MSAVVWLTGLPAAGKTTLAMAVCDGLRRAGRAAVLIDGDTMRAGVSNGLGFDPVGRAEAVRRAAHVARIVAESGVTAVAALISPSALGRDEARRICEGIRFAEVAVETPLWLCEQRDPKGLYAKAREGRLPGFTGIDSSYEHPEKPDFRINTLALPDPHQAAQRIVDWVLS